MTLYSLIFAYNIKNYNRLPVIRHIYPGFIL